MNISKKLTPFVIALVSTTILTSLSFAEDDVNKVPDVFTETQGMKLKPINAKNDVGLMAKKAVFDNALEQAHQMKTQLSVDKTRIKNMSGLSDEHKSKLIYMAERQHMNDTKGLVEKARLPFVNHIRDIAKTQGGNSFTESDGTPMYIQGEDGNRIRNPDHSGWASDHDFSASASETQRVHMIAKDIGLDDPKYQKYVDGNSPLLNSSDSTVDVKILEMTINRDMDLKAEVPGSSEHRAKVDAMAANVETFTGYSMDDDQPGKDAVLTHDLLNKAAEARNIKNPTREMLNDPNMKDGWERYNKSTKKMLEKSGKKFGGLKKGDLPEYNPEVERTIQAAINKNPDLKGMSAKEAYHIMADTKKRHSTEFKSDTELKAFMNMQNDIQDEVVRKMDNAANVERADAVKDIGNQKAEMKTADAEIEQLQQKKNGDGLSQKEVGRLNELNKKNDTLKANIEAGEKGVTDSDVRRQSTARENTKLGAFSSSKNKMKNARDGLNKVGDKVFNKTFSAMDKVDKLTKAYEVANNVGKELYNGNYSKAYENAQKMVVDELKDKAKEMVMGKLIPGYGQLSGAFDVGWMAGEQIGKLSISADGKTINQVAEGYMQSIFMSEDDRRSNDKDREAAIVLAITRSVKNGDLALPEGEKFSDIINSIRVNMILGDAPLDGIEMRPGANMLAKLRPVETSSAETTEEDDPWAVEEEDDASSGPIQVLDSSMTEDEKAEARYALQDRAKQDEIYKREQMQGEFLNAEQRRAEEARIKEQDRRELVAGFQAIAQGLQQGVQQIQAADAQLKAEVEANNANINAQVNAYSDRMNAGPSSADLISGKVTLDGKPYPKQGQYQPRTPATKPRVIRTPPKRFTAEPTGADVFNKMCNDLRRQGAEISDAECRQMAQKTKGVVINLNAATSFDDFVKRFCGYAETQKERKACEPRAKREFEKAIARQR